jgi:hypothetical protein
MQVHFNRKGDAKLLKQLLRRMWLSIVMAAVVIAQFGYISPKSGVAEAADNGLVHKPYIARTFVLWMLQRDPLSYATFLGHGRTSECL